MKTRAETIPAGGYFLPNSLCLTVRKYTSVMYAIKLAKGMQVASICVTINVKKYWL